MKAWKASKHAKGFRSLTKNPRRKVSRKIAKAMNVRLIKRGFCAGCHYTSIPRGNRTKAIAGVSCESCHGAAVDWVDVHQKFGDDDNIAKKDETPGHREMRLAKIKAAGMVVTELPEEGKRKFKELSQEVYDKHLRAERDRLIFAKIQRAVQDAANSGQEAVQ